jgi:hypothetical protein
VSNEIKVRFIALDGSDGHGAYVDADTLFGEEKHSGAPIQLELRDGKYYEVKGENK